MENLTITIRSADMLAIRRKVNSSGPLPDNLRNPSPRFGGVSADHFRHAIHRSNGNGHTPGNGRGESPTTGFLLLDASLRPIFASEEALAILAYPRVPPQQGFENFVQSRIRSLVSSDGNHNGFSPCKFLNEVASGERRYRLRAFSVKSNLGIAGGSAVAVLLERNHDEGLNLESVARKFRLTRRERETVDLLLRDLSTKQIAERMGISPNTAKAFLRSVMIKVGAENRTGIIARILQAPKSMNGETSS
jgi:DNA-binding CsgD family transcriptional regulator